jgi:2-dehydro-3-deoxy-L-rhamnonate dehydrogenase (NAD+)
MLACSIHLSTHSNTMNQYDMKGRHAVITGGATGLGYAIGQRMLASGGARHLVGPRHWRHGQSCGASQKTLAGAQVCNVDVAQHASVVQATAQTLKIAPVDALVNSAGITGPNTSCGNYPVDAWQQVMDINVNGVFYCCREWTPTFERPSCTGRIVNIASVAGKDGNPNASAYSASKAAVMAITKSLGKELANTGVRVNCASPLQPLTPPSSIR